MQPVSHQTVRLSKGRHATPEHGACVMELASMLAGERFSDHPRSVSRSIAAFLRDYNDLLDDQRRQDLYEYAARAVGTVGSPNLEVRRRQRLVQWGDDMRRCRRWAVLAQLKLRLRRPGPVPQAKAAARYAILSAGRISDETHAAVLALVDELIALGSASPHPLRPEHWSWETGSRARQAETFH